MSPSRPLALRRLALRTIRGDREAAIVLGDALLEMGLDRFATGRVRPVRFFAHSRSGASSGSWMIFYVPGRETLYNVDHFAGKEDEEAWSSIFTMWITSHRDIYRALLRSKLIPRSVKFHELVWQHAFRPGGRLAYKLYMRRIPKRRVRPKDTYLAEIDRSDTFQTEETQFGSRFETAPPPL